MGASSRLPGAWGGVPHSAPFTWWCASFCSCNTLLSTTLLPPHFHFVSFFQSREVEKGRSVLAKEWAEGCTPCQPAAWIDISAWNTSWSSELSLHYSISYKGNTLHSIHNTILPSAFYTMELFLIPPSRKSWFSVTSVQFSHKNCTQTDI